MAPNGIYNIRNRVVIEITDLDMKIALVPEARLTTAKLYQLIGEQSKILLDTLQRELAAGHIRPSDAAYGSPTFFVPKTDDRQRMVFDYHHLDSNTVPGYRSSISS